MNIKKEIKDRKELWQNTAELLIMGGKFVAGFVVFYSLVWLMCAIASTTL